MENFNLDITNIDAASIEVNSVTHQNDIAYSNRRFETKIYYQGDYENFFRRGKFCIFVGKKESHLGIKFFLHPKSHKLKSSTRFGPNLLEVLSLNQVKKIMKIHKTLEPYNLVPKCTRLVSFNVKDQIGYGIEMECLDPIEPPNLEQWKVFADKLRKKCKKHNLTRRGTLDSIIYDASYPKNYIPTHEGIKLIDIDVMWDIS